MTRAEHNDILDRAASGIADAMTLMSIIEDFTDGANNTSDLTIKISTLARVAQLTLGQGLDQIDTVYERKVVLAERKTA